MMRGFIYKNTQGNIEFLRGQATDPRIQGQADIRRCPPSSLVSWAEKIEYYRSQYQRPSTVSVSTMVSGV